MSDEEEAQEVFNYEVALCVILCHCNTMRRFLRPQSCVFQQEVGDDESGDDHTSDDDDDNDDEEAKESIDPLFKVDLQAALGNALANEDDDEDQADQSDSDFDDEAMMKLDEALAEVFKQHIKAKQDKKKVKGNNLTRRDMHSAQPSSQKQSVAT